MNNQNQLSGLDPKLQETFHRVMNTPTQPIVGGQSSTVIPAATANPLGTIQPPLPAPLPPLTSLGTIPSPAIAPAPIVSPQPAINQQPVQPTPFVAPTPTATPEKQEVIVISTEQPQQLNPTNSQVFSSRKKAGKISPVIMVLGGVIFFVVYALVWMKVFNAQIPFLP